MLPGGKELDFPNQVVDARTAEKGRGEKVEGMVGRVSLAGVSRGLTFEEKSFLICSCRLLPCEHLQMRACPHQGWRVLLETYQNSRSVYFVLIRQYMELAQCYRLGFKHIQAKVPSAEGIRQATMTLLAYLLHEHALEMCQHRGHFSEPQKGEPKVRQLVVTSPYRFTKDFDL